MPKQKKQLKEINGKLDKPTTLDQIWGDTGIEKYHTTVLAEYERELKEYNSTDLWTHAAKVGVQPIENRERLTKILLAEFQKHVNQYKNPPVIKPTNIKKGKEKEVLRILQEGR